MMPAAARPPKAPPMVKPQNMRVTRNERLRSGLYSEVSVIAIGMAPPSPRPVRKRQTASISTFVAQAEAILARPKPKVEKIRTALRPIRSAIGPNTKAPAIRPARPDTNSSESCGGIRFHCSRSAGAMKPIAAVSNPSAATTKKQRIRTVIWKRLNGRALMKFWMSTVCAGASLAIVLFLPYSPGSEFAFELSDLVLVDGSSDVAILGGPGIALGSDLGALDVVDDVPDGLEALQILIRKRDTERVLGRNRHLDQGE